MSNSLEEILREYLLFDDLQKVINFLKEHRLEEIIFDCIPSKCSDLDNNQLDSLQSDLEESQDKVSDLKEKVEELENTVKKLESKIKQLEKNEK